LPPLFTVIVIPGAGVFAMAVEIRTTGNAAGPSELEAYKVCEAALRLKNRSQLLSIFAVVAVFLAGMGIYGVVSYFVTRHTHDIGIRMALGAHPSNILRWVASLAAKLVVLGILVGVGLALGLTRAISALLFGVTPTDPTTFLVVAITLALVACVACYIPARRATKLDPLVSLRYE
jgi:ABC-type antimicrobial peptide transport system permease subunit